MCRLDSLGGGFSDQDALARPGLQPDRAGLDLRAQGTLRGGLVRFDPLLDAVRVLLDEGLYLTGDLEHLGAAEGQLVHARHWVSRIDFGAALPVVEEPSGDDN
jgi:hypothetical protein